MVQKTIDKDFIDGLERRGYDVHTYDVRYDSKEVVSIRKDSGDGWLEKNAHEYGLSPIKETPCKRKDGKVIVYSKVN